ncbi:hypothetical protein MVEN_02014900 [Mycena venus]|uniref:NAD(P)-binding protein n=1 Tax=Mycena venus TaxID=2733690 RepID=A0A8H7CJ68_9AGAR|nr:hypothetical protein MVEN_02014900 [Mycena venus]
MSISQDYTRVAIVTGGAQNIGKAISLRLAADGLDVAVADLPGQIDLLNTVVEEIQRMGCKAVAVAVDVTKEDDVKAMVEATVSTLGRLDVMVANAGVGATRVQPVMDADIQDWEKGWDVNIKGVLLCYKYAARQLVKQGNGGRIIGASSICGLRGYAGVGGYCISKAAVRSLTQTTVIETNMMTIEADKEHGPGFGAKSLLKILDFRTGQPADVANAVSFLASPDSHFITGQTISMNDGVHFS